MSTLAAAARQLEAMREDGLIEVVGEALNRGVVEHRYRALGASALGRRGVGGSCSAEEQRRLVALDHAA